MIEEAFRRVEARQAVAAAGGTLYSTRYSLSQPHFFFLALAPPPSSEPSDVESLDTGSFASLDSDAIDLGDLQTLVGASVNPTVAVSGDMAAAVNTPVAIDTTRNVAGPSTAEDGNTAQAADGADENDNGDGDVLKGFVCVACNTYNLLRPAKKSWYAVTNGRKVGVFCDW